MDQKNMKNMERFWSDPVMIEAAPRGGSVGKEGCGSDWEFATDVLAVGAVEKIDNKCPFAYLCKADATVDVNEFMFKGGFPNYGLFNVDKEDLKKALRCNEEGCVTCNQGRGAALASPNPRRADLGEDGGVRD
jgi:hypothetical protein